jgi:hypothetical protein
MKTTNKWHIKTRTLSDSKCWRPCKRNSSQVLDFTITIMITIAWSASESERLPRVVGSCIHPWFIALHQRQCLKNGFGIWFPTLQKVSFNLSFPFILPYFIISLHSFPFPNSTSPNPFSKHTQSIWRQAAL